ncbi:hypothetical protein DSCO28_58060 [Desulfosarcina ovata subsp. sediminis]|uniref:Zinc ribbon domain-containing protein n=3 Tax=Desulfosarcina ovata TaxID=83564 RepID=A0A5K8AHG9_9BACT|nr:hypothetical protein DSCO28_58060 [Desulfosarcina ovata subsp. sediminis]BBO92132.1 hypothetical protein DSCOOX_53120 [Desulfosarcina ovata subsp. ovata]
MHCPKCNYEQADDNSECLSCGIVFAKWQKRQAQPPPMAKSASDDDEEPQPGLVGALLFHLPAEVNPVSWGLRALLLAVMVLWGMKFVFASIDSDAAMNSFWHLVNLPFHEAGHIFFRPFGRLITSAGGSLMQVLMPAICLVVFLIKTRDPFAGAFALWWMGQNFIDLAPYINDARSLSLPLLGGNVGKHSPYGFHDWEFILRETGLIRLDHAIARLSHGVGAMLMITAVVWGGVLLARQYRRMRQQYREDC